jgi:anti-sigma factor RsiW
MPRALGCPEPRSCDEVAARLSDYLDGELEAAQASAVAAHLSWCEECARFAAELALTVTALRHLTPRPGTTIRWLAGLVREA